MFTIWNEDELAKQHPKLFFFSPKNFKLGNQGSHRDGRTSVRWAWSSLRGAVSLWFLVLDTYLRLSAKDALQLAKAGCCALQQESHHKAFHIFPLNQHTEHRSFTQQPAMAFCPQKFMLLGPIFCISISSYHQNGLAIVTFHLAMNLYFPCNLMLILQLSKCLELLLCAQLNASNLSSCTIQFAEGSGCSSRSRYPSGPAA